MPEGLPEMLLSLSPALPLLLQLYWILAAASVTITLLAVPLPTMFKDAVHLSAARGKLWSSRPQTLAGIKDMSVPQVWFYHFYAVGALVNGLLMALLLNSCPQLWSKAAAAMDAMSIQLAVSMLGLAAFQFHLIRRLLETLTFMIYPSSARMHVIAYVFGISYYIVVPLSLLPKGVFSIQEHAVDGPEGMRAATLLHWMLLASQRLGLSGVVRGTLSTQPLMMAWERATFMGSVLCTMGLVVFFGGNLVQFWSHVALARLSCSSNKEKQHIQAHVSSQNEKSYYKIPMGGLFELISCPHYFGEILIYAGLLMLMQGQLNAALMLFWVVVNLILAADATQKWYHKTFDEYPKQRKALFPFVW